jgi:DedD protein
VPEFTETGPEAVDFPEQPTPPGLTAKGIPGAWVVQVGSFRDRSKADSLTQNLIGDGYKAYMRSGKSAGAPMYRVFVGPDVLKSKSLEYKKAVDRKYRVKSLVRQFEP